MNDAQQVFDGLITQHVSPMLTEAGFKKSRLNWYRDEDGRWLIVNLQKSAWTGQEDVAFTINLAVSPVADDVKPPPYYRCRKRVRIGTLLDGGEDVWWTVAREEDMDRVGAQVAAALREKALPWLTSSSFR